MQEMEICNMNDGIKEILDKWKCYIGLTKKFSNNDMELLRAEDIEKVLDYITNLQQENERLKEDNRKKTKRCTERNHRIRCRDRKLERRDKKISKLENYKFHCEKAIEYFKYQLENLDFYEDTKARMLCAMGITLLQNGSDSQ